MQYKSKKVPWEKLQKLAINIIEIQEEEEVSNIKDLKHISFPLVCYVLGGG